MEPEVISACQNVCRDFYWVGPLTEWLGNLGIPVGVGIAWYQLNLWRREHLAKRNAETSLQLLSKAVSIKRAISATRSAIEQIPTEAKDRSDALVEVKWKRLASYNDDFDELRELQVLHEALVGTDAVRNAVDTLFDVRQELFAALDTLHGWKLSPLMSAEDREFHRKLTHRISSISAKGDEILPLVNGAIRILQEELVPEIRMQSR